MRFFLFTLGLFGLYRYWRAKGGSGPKGLLSGMRAGEAQDATGQVIYEIVEHDGGWAYKVGDVFSEAFPTRDEAGVAAQQAAEAHEAVGRDTFIQYQDSEGRWHEEVEAGRERPHTQVAGTNVNRRPDEEGSEAR